MTRCKTEQDEFGNDAIQITRQVMVDLAEMMPTGSMQIDGLFEVRDDIMMNKFGHNIRGCSKKSDREKAGGKEETTAPGAASTSAPASAAAEPSSYAPTALAALFVGPPAI